MNNKFCHVFFGIKSQEKPNKCNLRNLRRIYFHSQQPLTFSFKEFYEEKKKP